MESAIISVVRRMLLEGLKRHHSEHGAIAPEMAAATMSWAIYGAAKEWAQTPDRCTSEEIAGTVMILVSPILNVTLQSEVTLTAVEPAGQAPT